MLNLDFYKGADGYSDGDIENELLEIVSTHDDFHSLVVNDNRWPVLYHLSRIRRNLLEWYPFDKTKDFLEIGAGCGALTGLFCERTRQVTAVELSKRRAEIIDARYRNHDNLEIIVGNFQDINFTQCYDYISLIGVLEYAGMFIDSPEPFLDFLRQVRHLLKPKGRLFVAIENQFGLKYFAGAQEDHLAQPFVGLEGYPVHADCKTFSRYSLEALLQQAGYEKNIFYYPYPDYKMPNSVFSDDYLPSPGDLSPHSPNYDYDRHVLFNEQKVFAELTDSGQFPFFANSFLTESMV